MEEKLTQEMKEVIAKLGELVKADPRCSAIQSSVDEYERSDELNELIAEYHAQQNILADAYGKDDANAELNKNVQARIDELYKEITTHPVYVAYIEAKKEFDELTNEIYGELHYAITGQRPCSHNCGSCGGGCGHEH